MENAAKALEMTAGILLGVMIMALIVMFFSNVKAWPSQQEEELTVDQLAKFNLEYEVYDKSLMYGVDVLSCLNKIQNNNQKYVEGFGFMTGDRYGEFNARNAEYKYLINCKVKIKSPLEEHIEVYYLEPDVLTGKLSEKQIFSISQNKVGKENVSEAFKNTTLQSMGFKRMTDKNYTLFLGTEKLGNIYKDGKYTRTLSGGKFLASGTTYQFYTQTGNKLKINEELGSLIAMSDLLYQHVKNYGSTGSGDWTNAVWYTAVYDFKKKKFTCTDIKYNPETNRVSEICFEEK